MAGSSSLVVLVAAAGADRFESAWSGQSTEIPSFLDCSVTMVVIPSVASLVVVSVVLCDVDVDVTGVGVTDAASWVPTDVI